MAAVNTGVILIPEVVKCPRPMSATARGSSFWPRSPRLSSSPAVRRRVLRILCRQGRRHAVQRGLAGDHGPRDGNRTVISMANDYRGELTEFALVVPVPQVLEKGQIHIGERKLFERIDAFSAPRLAEYYDANPCALKYPQSHTALVMPPPRRGRMMKCGGVAGKALGVTVEASYTVGEYDIAILSAKQSDGLETWLRENGYRIPKRAAAALQPLHPAEHEILRREGEPRRSRPKTGVAYLRPLQFAFESEKFMLPVRLGMLNAQGPAGPRPLRADAERPRRDDELPDDQAAREHGHSDLRAQRVRARRTRRSSTPQAAREDYRAIFTEYFWDMSWCDSVRRRSADAQTSCGRPARFWPSAPVRRRAAGDAHAACICATRAKSLPEDLAFQETADRQNFQVALRAAASLDAATNRRAPRRSRISTRSRARRDERSRRRWPRLPAATSTRSARGWRSRRRRTTAGGSALWSAAKP